MPKQRKRKSKQEEQARRLEPWEEGWQMAARHPMLGAMLRHIPWQPGRSSSNIQIKVTKDSGNQHVAHEGWAAASPDGIIWCNHKREGNAAEWAWVFAYCMLQYGFGHLPCRQPTDAWIAASDAVVTAFMESLKLGLPPEHIRRAEGAPARDHDLLFRRFSEGGVPPAYQAIGVNAHRPDILTGEVHEDARQHWESSLGEGMMRAMRSAIQVASGKVDRFGAQYDETPAQKAQSWFISNYPLLGALAASFTLVEDIEVCHGLGVAIAAVSAEESKVFFNPFAGLDEEEIKFVLAHELLHIGLRHHARCQGRDPYIWNLACDYVINGWLLEMQIGTMPERGSLFDPAYKGLSAESIYQLLLANPRSARRLETFRGYGMGDIIDGAVPSWWSQGTGADLDTFYRNCLAQGLDYHRNQGRGFLPLGLIQEIQALSHPPIPWDVKLAQWFDSWLPPLERRRSYARLSRRQQSTPKIPRPRWIKTEESQLSRTFGVILDTSGSMSAQLLARSLGAIASYAVARDVPAVRVIFCDAYAYDQGYMPPEDIAQRVKVRGRGGTMLQPGIDLLEAATDFPTKGPMLIITDGECDLLHIRREHAFLLPKGKRLPFNPKGPIFHMD